MASARCPNWQRIHQSVFKETKSFSYGKALLLLFGHVEEPVKTMKNREVFFRHALYTV